MCGRYALYGPISRKRPAPDATHDWLADLIGNINKRAPRFNFAPTQLSPIVIGGEDAEEVLIRDHRWGLVPFWAKDVKIGNKAINARAETVAEKPMFRTAFKTRRCLIPANCYFEWKGTAPNKQPYFIHDTGADLMLFAGLWESWGEKDADKLLTYTIVTGPPGLVSGDIHDRAPVILPANQWTTWVTGTPNDAAEILSHVPQPSLAYYPVNKAVGSPRNDREELVEPIDA